MIVDDLRYAREVLDLDNRAGVGWQYTLATWVVHPPGMFLLSLVCLSVHVIAQVELWEWSVYLSILELGWLFTDKIQERSPKICLKKSFSSPAAEWVWIMPQSLSVISSYWLLLIYRVLKQGLT